MIKDLLIVLIVLLVLLTLISTFGGSMRFEEKYTDASVNAPSVLVDNVPVPPMNTETSAPVLQEAKQSVMSEQSTAVPTGYDVAADTMVDSENRIEAFDGGLFAPF